MTHNPFVEGILHAQRQPLAYTAVPVCHRSQTAAAQPASRVAASKLTQNARKFSEFLEDSSILEEETEPLLPISQDYADKTCASSSSFRSELQSMRMPMHGHVGATPSSLQFGPSGSRPIPDITSLLHGLDDADVLDLGF
jgi:hypothetical protein